MAAVQNLQLDMDLQAIQTAIARTPKLKIHASSMTNAALIFLMLFSHRRFMLSEARTD